MWWIIIVFALIAYVYYSASNVESDYATKVSILESNLAEVSLKIDSLNSSNTLKAESDLIKIKKDIETNMLENVETLKNYVSKEEYSSEIDRIKNLIEQYRSIDKDLVDSYKKEMDPFIKNLEAVGGKVKELILANDITFAQLKEISTKSDLKSIIDDLQSLKTNYTDASASIQSIKDNIAALGSNADAVSDAMKNLGKATDSSMQSVISELRTAIELVKTGNQESINGLRGSFNQLINKSYEEIRLAVDSEKENKSVLSAIQNIIDSLKSDNLVLTNKVNNTSDLVQKISESMEKNLEFIKLEQTKVLNEYISASNSKTQALEKSLNDQISTIIDIKASVKKITDVIGDIDNLKFVPMLKGNIIDTIYDLNDRVKKYEGNSVEISNLQKVLDSTVESIGSYGKVATGFWDYSEILDPLNYSIQNLSLDLKEKNKKLFEEIRKIMLDAYGANSNKYLIHMRLYDALVQLKGIIDYNSTTNGLKTDSTMDMLLRMLGEMGKKLSMAEYINNIQKSVNSLHSKRVITDEDISILKSQVDSIKLNAANSSADVVKSLADLQKQITALSINNDLMAEIQMKIKSLDVHATQSWQMSDNVSQLMTKVGYLSNWVGGWGGSDGKDLPITNYVKDMNDAVNKNKDTQDKISESLEKLKKYIGEYTLTEDADLSNAVMRAQNTGTRALSLIGKYDWTLTDNKPLFEFISTLVSRINQIDVSIKSLDPTNTNSKITELNSAVKSINQTMTDMSSKILNSKDVYNTLDYFGTVLATNTKRLAFPPFETRTVNEIFSDMSAEITKIKTALIQVDTSKNDIAQLDFVIKNDRQYAIAVNDYVTRVDNSLSLLTANVSDISKSIEAAKNSMSTASTADTNALYIKAKEASDRLSSLENLTKRIQNEQPWWPLINSLTVLKAQLIGLSSSIPWEQYQKIETGVPIALDIFTNMSTNYSNFTYSKEYKTLSEFNTLMSTVWKTNLSSMKVAPTDGIAKVWANFSQYVNFTDYVNSAPTVNVQEPLWYYVQRKVDDIYKVLANKPDKETTNASINSLNDNLNSLSSKVTNIFNTYASKTDIPNLDNINSKVSLINDMGVNINSLTSSLKDLTAKVNTGSGSGGGIPINPSITLPKARINSSGITYLFTQGYFSKGSLIDAPYVYSVKTHSISNTSQLNGPLTESGNGTVSLIDMYNIISGAPPGSVTLYNNKISTVCNGQSDIFLNTQSVKTSDLHIFLSSIFNNTLPSKKGYLSKTGGQHAIGYLSRSFNRKVFEAENVEFVHTINQSISDYYQDGRNSTLTYESFNPGKVELIKILDSLMEYSDKCTCNISVLFGIGINTNTETGTTESINKAKANIDFLQQALIPAAAAKIYVDTAKSAFFAVPTLVSTGLLDVSKYGIVLNSSGLDIDNLKKISEGGAYSFAYVNGGSVDNVCEPNSYVCGLRFTAMNNMMTGQPMWSSYPYCCSFRKK